ncbi:MAG: MFS transporter [Anaerolineales bacterium]|jgi:DHA1 family tetracycline resistance protein-like MFS transporter
MKNRPLASIFLIVFIDLLGFGLILPLLPYYAETFGASDTVVGLLVASYAAAQLVGAPILGRFSDRFGRRPILLLSLVGTLLGFLLLGFANTLWILFAARIIDGLTGGNISVAQAYITDVTDAKSRAKGLGMIGAAFGLGFIIGPASGGLLSQWGYAVPAFVAAGLVTINLLMVSLWLPESLPPEKRETAASKRPSVNFSALMDALKRPFTGPLLITRFFFGLAFSTFQTIFALYALRRFNLDATQTGFILTYVGVLAAVVQGALVGRLSERFRDDVLIFVSVGIMALSLLGWALSPSVVVLLIILAPTAFAGGILNTVLSSALTKAVEPQEVGGILGLSASIESATRVIAPTVGGILLGRIGTWAPGAFGAILLAGLLFYVGNTIYNHPLAANEQGKDNTIPVSH